MTFVQGHECQQRVGPELLISQSKEGNMNGNKIPDFTGEKQSDYSGETRLFLILRPETDFSCGSSDRAQIIPSNRETNTSDFIGVSVMSFYAGLWLSTDLSLMSE